MKTIRKITILLVISFFIANTQTVFATPSGDNIIISEVEYDALAPDQAGEWFELYNPTGSAIDISNWTFTDGEGVVTIPATTSILSGGYFVATHTATGGFLTNYPTIPVDLEYGTFDVGNLAMANGGDELSISNAGATIVDAVSWGGAARFNISANEGTTIARATPADTDLEADWLDDQVSSPGSGLNSVPTDIKLDAGDVGSVNEGILTGTNISAITTVDVDTTDAHAYTLVVGTGDEDNAKFNTVGTNLQLNFTPDFETPTDLGDTAGNNTYSIRLQTNDGNGGIYSESFIITVNDVDENIPNNKKKRSSIKYTCKDTAALNYNKFGRHKASKCEYSIAAPATLTESNLLGGEQCSADKLIHNKMKNGDINGKYSLYNKGTVTEVSLLQSHINRILADQYTNAAGPVDVWFGTKTQEGVKRLQRKLNSLNTTLNLDVDGVVGPYTIEAINYSC